MSSSFNPLQDALLIPVFQGGDAFSQLLDRLLFLIPADRVLVVDDGSSDSSSEEARRRSVHLLRFEENRGKGAALEAGLRWWSDRGAVQIVALDADGQHPPELVSDLCVSMRRTGAGIVVGARDLRSRAMPPLRRLSNSMTTRLLSRLARVPLGDSQSGFRCYHRRIVDRSLFPQSGRFAWESEILVLAAWAGEKIVTTPVPVLYTPGGGSHIAHVRDTLRFLKLYIRLFRERRQSGR